MDIRNIAKIVFRLIVLVSVLLKPSYSHSMPQLPESDLSWKNVTVDSKKTAVFCLFRDSHGLMWLGTNSGLYFYDGVMTHPVGENTLFGTQIYSILEKNDKLYIGSNNGLLTYDFQVGTVSQYEVETPQEIRTMLLNDDELWIGGLNGISKLNLRDKTFMIILMDCRIDRYIHYYVIVEAFCTLAHIMGLQGGTLKPKLLNR